MPMLALLLLHAVLSSIGSGGVDAGPTVQAGLATASSNRPCLQLRLRQDSVLQWECGVDPRKGDRTHALGVSHRVEGRWQLRRRISFSASGAH